MEHKARHYATYSKKMNEVTTKPMDERMRSKVSMSFNFEEAISGGKRQRQRSAGRSRNEAKANAACIRMMNTLIARVGVGRVGCAARDHSRWHRVLIRVRRAKRAAAVVRPDKP